ncbi:hypothetical protein AB0J74_07920 [Asanoa sp. NPDC049573]|uniref:hypothetical protein n=1 Tax=Asanoa sp. NPDC049573 TaxID=3155396 RepID=UPI003429136D
MRARLFGRWVGRAAVFVVLGFGALVVGGIASAETYVDHAGADSVAPAVSQTFNEAVVASLSWDWG